MTMTRSFYKYSLELLKVRLLSDTNLVANYYNGLSGIGATLTAVSVGALTVDGVLVNLGDDILVNNQTIKSQNGIYTVMNTGSPTTQWVLQRRSDFQSVEQIVAGQFLTIGAGTSFAGTIYTLIEPAPAVIGTSPIMFSPPAAGGTGFLLAANNLDDVQSAAISRTNLGLGTASTEDVGFFLQSANDLSDVASPSASATNLGLGTTDDVTFNSSTTPFFSEIPVNTTTTLTNSAFGKMILCTGASAYTITLPSPSGNAGKYIDFTFLPTSNALVTLLPPSGDIDNEALLIYGANEGCTLYCDGTNYCVIWQKLFKPSFFVTLSAPFTLPYLTFTKIPFNVITLNTGQFYDPNTNFRFTPLYPGVYSCFLSGSLLVGGGTVNNTFQMSIYKNGSSYLLNQLFQSGAAPMSTVASGLIAFNGTTDYIEAFGFESNTSTFNQPLSNTSNVTYFQGIRVSNYMV